MTTFVIVQRMIDVDCACWHDLTVTVSLFHERFPRARGQQNTATTGHLSVLKPLNPSTPMVATPKLRALSLELYTMLVPVIFLVSVFTRYQMQPVSVFSVSILGV